MLVLAIDCAWSACGVCLWQDGRVLALAGAPMERGQDAALLPLVQKAMADAGTAYAALDRVGVTRGPGSFTGLRIGLAAARGIGLAAEKPVIGIDRFRIFAMGHDPARPLLIALRSKRQELYCRFAPPHTAPLAPVTLTPDEIAAQYPDAVIAGDAHDLLRPLMPDAPFSDAAMPEVVACAMLASGAEAGQPDFLPRPLYLRAPDVTLNAEQRRGQA